MTRERAVLLMAIATVLAAVVLMLADPGFVWLRVVVGVPFILLLPGHALMLLADPDGQLGRVEWFALSVGASISITILAGMWLAYSSYGLSAHDMIVTLAAVTLITAVASLARTASQMQEHPQPVQRNSVQRASLGALMLVACTLLVLLVSISGSRNSDSGRVVQLWSLPDSAGGVRIGANNVNSSSEHYRLTIEQGGRLISEQDLRMPARSSRVFEVKRSATWTTNAPVAAVLTDVGGLVAPLTISVWATE